MALEFTNTRDEPLIGSDLTKFLLELNWKGANGQCVFKEDGYVEYMVERCKYEVEDPGQYRMSSLIVEAMTSPNKDDRRTSRIVEWLGTYIKFRLSGEKEINIIYYPIVQKGKYYLIRSSRYNGYLINNIFAEGFAPPPPPTPPNSETILCSICMEKPANCAPVPCGHKCGCEECFTKVMEKDARCPICRTNIDRVIRIFDMASPNYASAVVKKVEESFDIENMETFPPLPSPEYIVNLNSRYNVFENGRIYTYSCGEFLNKFNKDSKNIVLWKLSNGDEQHGRICKIYNQLYISMIDKFPQFKPKFPIADTAIVSLCVLVESFTEEHKKKTNKPVKPAPQIQKQTVSNLSSNARSWTPSYQY
jgi:hypothetical protein